jgi:hypothetical protein
MAFGDIQGRAKTNPHQPRAQAVCDFCGEHYMRIDLIDQMEFYGDVLTDTGYRACPRCISKPQPQLKPVILPEDPVPIVDPRVEVYSIPADQAVNPTAAAISSASVNNNGFLQFIGPQGVVIGNPVVLQFGVPNAKITNEPVTELDPTQLFTVPTQVIASSKTGWGLPQPQLAFQGGVIKTSGVGQLVMTPNTTRTYLLIYSPYAGMLAISQNGTPTLGIPPGYWANPYTAAPSPAEVGTVIVGIGQGVLQNGLLTPPASVWQGSIWVLGLIPGQPYWAWQGNLTGFLVDHNGNVLFDHNGQPILAP